VNIQGLHNLCVVYVERGFLSKAYACLHEAHALAPQEDYIIKHLQIIETRMTKIKAQPGQSREKELAFAEFDPRDFGGHVVTKDNKVNLKVSQFSSTQNQAEMLQTSKEPEFLEPNHPENYQKHEGLKRIQNNYATDLDDPSSGMS
jgi:protein O-mannosyl-transferase